MDRITRKTDTFELLGRLGSRVMWWGRKGMKDRVASLVANTERRMIDVVNELCDDLPVFELAAA